MPQHPPPPHLNPTRLKTSLKMAISKLKFIQEKKTALTKQQRRQLANLLNQGKEASAKIRVENIIRDDIYIELLEYLELYCELLLARISILLDPNRTSIDPSLKEAAQSIIFAAPHTELKELTSIREILVFKYGQEFGKNAIENLEGIVPKKIIARCQVDPPSETLVNLYLCEISKAYEAPFSGLKDLQLSNSDNDDDEPGAGEAIKAKLNAPIAETVSDSTNSKVRPASNSIKAQDEYDSLKARFAALKGGS